MKASRVCPLSVLPARSLTVTESIMGRFFPNFPIAVSAASIATFALRVSKIVSMRMMSAPPSISPSICSE